MAENSWCSKADIIKDLVEVTGKVDDVDERYIVVGEMPPPPMPNDEEVCGDYNEAPRIPEIEPDLDGISQMLRKVEDETADEHAYIESSETTVISKLNPNVPEFIPKCATSNNNEEYGIIGNNNNVINNSNYDAKNNMYSCNYCYCNAINKEDTTPHNDVNIDKRIDIQSLNPEEIRNMTHRLRKKISDPPNENGAINKREKYVAIATLLRLYSITPGTISPDTKKVVHEKSFELFTPKYFSSTKSFTYENKNESSTSRLNRSGILVTSNSSLKTSVENECYEDRFIRKSIKKVNYWFEKPASRKVKIPVLFMGPISFRIKENNTNESPTSNFTSKHPTPQVAQYRPSKYADDLSKRYMEQSKKSKELSQDIWARAMNIMKEKEEKNNAAVTSSDASSYDVTVSDNCDTEPCSSFISSVCSVKRCAH